MKVVKPVELTPAMLISSTATESTSAWNSGTSYTLGQTCYLVSTGRLYECIQAPSLNKSPATEPTYWLDTGPTNTWAMFDSQISTETSQASPLTVVVAPGYVNSLALFELTGTDIEVTVRDGLAGPVVYSYSQSLDGALFTDWYQYFFDPAVQLSEVVLTDLPPYQDAHITVTVLSDSAAAVGAMLLGTVYFLGEGEFGATAGITDYSRKDTSATGITTFVRRAYSKRMSIRLMLDTVKLNQVQRILADLRATPCAWIGTDTAGFEPLTLYGFYRDFSLEIAYPSFSYCNLEIEGLT